MKLNLKLQKLDSIIIPVLISVTGGLMGSLKDSSMTPYNANPTFCLVIIPLKDFSVSAITQVTHKRGEKHLQKCSKSLCSCIRESQSINAADQPACNLPLYPTPF